MKKVLSILIVCVLAISCKPKASENQPFPLPNVPSMINGQDEELDFIVTHYWEPFFSENREYPSDTSLLLGISKEAFRQAYMEYITYLTAVSVPKSLQAQQILLDKAEAFQTSHSDCNIWREVIALSDIFLFDPNSPFRSEEMYIPVQEKLLNSPLASKEQKTEAARLLPLLKLNRLGTTATDFLFTLRNGRQMKLSDIQAQFTILLFSNPDCDNCKEVIEYIGSLNEVDNLINNQFLAVVNVHPDSDLTEWFEYASIYPTNWYNGFDQDMAIADKLYNIRAIPSVYLLDRNKTIILKDSPIETVIAYLQNL